MTSVEQVLTNCTKLLRHLTHENAALRERVKLLTAVAEAIHRWRNATVMDGEEHAIKAFEASRLLQEAGFGTEWGTEGER